MPGGATGPTRRDGRAAFLGGKSIESLTQARCRTYLPSSLRTVTALAICAFFLGLPRLALAGDLDPTPERLVLQPPNLPAGETCQSIAASPDKALAAGTLPTSLNCRPDNMAFRNYVSELGFAIAPTANYPARTTGIGGIALTIEAAYTKVNSDGQSIGDDRSTTSYWRKGTQGSKDTGSNQFSRENTSPNSLLSVYTLKARKGLPFGFELVGALGTISGSSLWVVGADARWSLLEGFRSGALGVLPDFSVGGGVRTLTGTSKFHLTAVGFDVKASKPIPIADSATLTPHVGYQRLFIFGDSTITDFTPNTDALRECGYAGPDPRTGVPSCRNKLASGADNNVDFNNFATFDKVRVHRHRMMFGATYKYEILYVGGQFLIDATPPDSENYGLQSTRQWTLSLEGGVFF